MNASMSSLQKIETGNFAPRRWVLCPPDSIGLVSWNIDRGLQLKGIIDFLASAKADLVLLQEADLNARRTHHLDVTREIARSLQMNYVFAREFQELTQGSRASPAYHGQATLSRWPLTNLRIIRFQRQSNFWRPHWFLPDISPFQERIGGRMALVSDASIGAKTLVTYNLHLESKGDDALRLSQLDEVIGDSRRNAANAPIVLAGDFNLDVSRGEAATALRRAQFQDAFSNQHMKTTPAHFFLDRGEVIDWIFTRGPIRPSQPKVHRSVSASDHFPLSITLEFT
jgi:endonuclease/exonuclease/phosphatase family metal-dependent hydrolase